MTTKRKNIELEPDLRDLLLVGDTGASDDERMSASRRYLKRNPPSPPRSQGDDQR